MDNITKNFKKITIEKIGNLVLNALIIIFSVILLISIYTNIQTRFMKKDYADFFGYSVFDVQTGSMEDTISAGDWIVVKLTQKVKLNDIITYKLDNDYITHRVVEVYAGTYLTRGDANPSDDDKPVDQSQIVGKVVSIIPNFGILRKTIFNPGVLITLIITIVLFSFAFKKDKVFNDNNLLGSIIRSITKLLKKFKKSDKETAFYNDFEIHNSDLVSEPVLTKENLSSKKTENNENELIFRTLNTSEEDDNQYEEVKQELAKEEVAKMSEEDLEKTILYRVISVDSSEINDTLLEIAQNELKSNDSDDSDKLKKLQAKLETVTPEDESLTEINLDLLKNNASKKGKNVIDTTMIIKKEELNELINILIEESYNKTIHTTFINAYIDIKYYNHNFNDGTNYEGNLSITRIRKIIQQTANNLLKTNPKKADIINEYSKAFSLIIGLDLAKDSITDLKAKKEFYKKEILKCFKEWNLQITNLIVNELIRTQRKYNNTLEYFLKKLETNMFDLNFNKLSKKGMYALDLKHNIAFSKVYSEYIIDKTYANGIIAEDKMEVLLTLLSGQLAKDMINAKFNTKYILYIPDSLYDKEKKLEKTIRMIEDKYTKDNIYIVIDFKVLLSHKKIVKELRKKGYKFAIAFAGNITVNTKNSKDLVIADYIFINKKAANANEIIASIPKELIENVVYDDVETKVGGFGGEEI